MTTSSSAVWKGLEWVLGLSVRLKTLTNEEVYGRIYSYDSTTNCVALECTRKPASSHSGALPKHDFRIFKISYIKEITVVSPPASPTANGDSENHNGTVSAGGAFATASPAVGYVQVDRMQAREAQTIKETFQQQARIGVGVTIEGQEIFDALSKTLPCRWAKDSIVVLGEVIISPPYETENCKANSSSATSLARVKKVLEGEKGRIANARKQ